MQRPAVGRAYFYGAIAMSLIPLLAAVGAVVFLRRRARSLAAAEQAGPGAARGPLPSRG